MKLSAITALLILVASPATADRLDQIRAYTRPAAAAFFAQQNCPGFHVNVTRLVLLRAAVRIQDSEETIVDRDLPLRVAETRQAFDRAGASSWCANIRDLLGRGGSLVPGLLD